MQGRHWVLRTCALRWRVLRLQDAMKLYCLCKLPHDGERPMLQCDSCRDWFHWDCVGLTPPGDDEDDEEVAPADFQCPSCCVKVSILPADTLTAEASQPTTATSH